MNIMSCTFTIIPKGDKFEAYCEEAKQVITGHAATGCGNTPSEAMEDAYNRLLVGIEDEKELEVQAALDELLVSDDCIPGGFGGPCEFSDELESAIKDLISMVREGMTEREQHKVSGYILEAIASVEVDRVPDDDEENDA